MSQSPGNWIVCAVMVLVEVEPGPHAQERAVERVHRALSGLDRPWRMRVAAEKRLQRAAKRTARERER